MLGQAMLFLVLVRNLQCNLHLGTTLGSSTPFGDTSTISFGATRLLSSSAGSEQKAKRQREKDEILEKLSSHPAETIHILIYGCRKKCLLHFQVYGSPAPRQREKAEIFQTLSTTSFGGSSSGSGIALGLFRSTRATFRSGSGAPSSDEKDVSITKADLISWAKRLYYEGKPEYALEILEWMDRNEMKFSPSELQLYVGTLCKVRGFESGRAYFEKVEPDFDKNNTTAKNAFAFMTLMTWKDDWPPRPMDLDFICDRKKLGDFLWRRTNK